MLDRNSPLFAGTIFGIKMHISPASVGPLHDKDVDKNIEDIAEFVIRTPPIPAVPISKTKSRPSLEMSFVVREASISPRNARPAPKSQRITSDQTVLRSLACDAFSTPLRNLFKVFEKMGKSILYRSSNDEIRTNILQVHDELKKISNIIIPNGINTIQVPKNAMQQLKSLRNLLNKLYLNIKLNFIADSMVYMKIVNRTKELLFKIDNPKYNMPDTLSKLMNEIEKVLKT